MKMFLWNWGNGKEHRMEETLKAHFLRLYHMVISDGIVESKELEVLYRIGQENYQLSPEDITRYISSVGTSYTAKDDVETQITILYEMAEIAWADGVIDEAEKSLLARYAIRFGFEKENAEAIADFMFEQIKNGTSKESVINQILNN